MFHVHLSVCRESSLLLGHDTPTSRLKFQPRLPSTSNEWPRLALFPGPKLAATAVRRTPPNHTFQAPYATFTSSHAARVNSPPSASCVPAFLTAGGSVRSP